MNSNPLLHFWIIIDMVIMFFTLPYTYFSKVFMFTGEITKNVFTLYQVQKRKLKTRRENTEKGANGYKNFFEEEERKTDAAEAKLGGLSRKKTMMLKAG